MGTFKRPTFEGTYKNVQASKTSQPRYLKMRSPLSAARNKMKMTIQSSMPEILKATSSPSTRRAKFLPRPSCRKEREVSSQFPTVTSTQSMPTRREEVQASHTQQQISDRETSPLLAQTILLMETAPSTRRRVLGITMSSSTMVELLPKLLLLVPWSLARKQRTLSKSLPTLSLTRSMRI